MLSSRFAQCITHLTFLFALGCSSLASPWYTSRISDLDKPLQILQKVVVAALPMGLRNNSTNGREFFSKYFVPAKGTYKDAGAAIYRYSAHITILGAVRPYTVEILVIKEERVLSGEDFAYEMAGHDSRLAKHLENSIRTSLTKRREDLNIIDDFRAF